MWSKLITSSVDPAKTSLTVKGILLSLIPIAMAFGVDTSGFTGIAEGIERVIFFSLSLISAAQIVVGLARKLAMGKWSA